MSASSPGLTPDQAAAIAKLARLAPGPALLNRFAAQSVDILSAMETLAEVDTSGVSPMYSPMEHAAVLREDTAKQVHSRDAILQNAPETDGEFFIVPRIV